MACCLVGSIWHVSVQRECLPRKTSVSPFLLTELKKEILLKESLLMVVSGCCLRCCLAVDFSVVQSLQTSVKPDSSGKTIWQETYIQFKQLSPKVSVGELCGRAKAQSRDQKNCCFALGPSVESPDY